MPPTPRKRTASKPTTPRAIVESVQPQDPYAPSAWGSAPGAELEDFIVPSGQKCLVRRPGVEQLLLEGVLFETDYLTSMVHQNIEMAEKGIEPKDITMEEIIGDPETFKNVVETVDRIVCTVVVKPAVQRPPNDITLRKPGQIYTDMIELADRFAILDFALGGSRELTDFRDESAKTVGSARARKANGSGPQRSTRHK